MPDGEQAHRSRHHTAFLEPDAADIVLADDARWLRERWAAAGVPDAAMAAHLAVIGDKETMQAALAWYRAPWRDSDAARPDPRADALYLG